MEEEGLGHSLGDNNYNSSFISEDIMDNMNYLSFIKVQDIVSMFYYVSVATKFIKLLQKQIIMQNML